MGPPEDPYVHILNVKLNNETRQALLDIQEEKGGALSEIVRGLIMKERERLLLTARTDS